MDMLRQAVAGMIDTGSARTLEDLFVKLVAEGGQSPRLSYV